MLQYSKRQPIQRVQKGREKSFAGENVGPHIPNTGNVGMRRLEELA